MKSSPSSISISELQKEYQNVKAIGKSLVLVSDKYTKETGERSDCVVRALSLSYNLPYSRVYSILLAKGRKVNKGTYRHTINKSIDYINSFHNKQALEMDMYLVHDTLCEEFGTARYITLGKFCKVFNKGVYYVEKKDHAFCVIDGVVHDWYNGSVSSATRLYKIFMIHDNSPL